MIVSFFTKLPFCCVWMVSFILIYCLSISTFPNKHFPLTQRVGTSSRSVIRLEKPPNTLFDFTLTLTPSGTVMDTLPRIATAYLHFFSFLPHKVIVDRLTAVNKNVLTRTEFVRYRQEICPVCNFLGCRPALEWRFTHNLCPKLGIVHHTLI